MQKVKFYHLSNLSKTYIASIFFFFFLISSCKVQSQVPSYPIKTINGVECMVYEVKPKEGFYRIGKNFNTTEDVIREFNPHITDGLKVGMKIYIPVYQEETPTQTVQTKDTFNAPNTVEEEYLEHKVKRKQTIFSISYMYQISEEELIEMNPHLKNNVLKRGEIIKIPIIKEAKEDTEIKEIKDDALSLIEQAFRRQETDNQKIDKKRKNTYNIAFLLPFMLDQRLETSDKRFIEFYAGSLLAIKQLKEKRINFNIHAFDVAKTEIKLNVLIENGELNDMDLIIGPAYSSQIPLICDFARTQKIKTLIPFSSKVYNLDSNEYIYQFNPGQDLETQKIKNILNSEEIDSNIIFADISNINPSDDAYIRSISLKHFMDDNSRLYKTVNLHPDSVHLIRQALNPMKDNLIFFNTSRINHVSIYLRELHHLSATLNLKFYEPYSWKGTRAEKPRSCYISAFKTDISNKSFEAYIKDFQDTFNWLSTSELPKYDILGYDLVNYFVQYILPSKDNAPSEYPFYEGLQSNFHFEKTSILGGYINTELNHYE